MADTAVKVLTTGRRKKSIARVFLASGTGKITVNKRPIEDYFKTQTLRAAAVQPLVITKNSDKFDVSANVNGGGMSGQAGAVRLGIARALLSIDEGLKKLLRANGFLTRDPRGRERKKYGQKRARRRFQYTKR